MATTERSRTAAARDLTRRTAFLPLALVLVSLASLALLPWITMLRTSRDRNTIAAVAQPARALVTEIQGELALEAAANRAYLLTQDERFAAHHAQTGGRRREAVAALLPLAERLGEEAHRDAVTLRRALSPADALLDSLLRGEITSRVFLARMNEQQAHFQEAVAAAVRLDDAISRGAGEALRAMDRERRQNAAITLAVVLLGLVAAALVARLAYAYRGAIQALAGSEERFRQITDSVHDVVWLTDARFTHLLYVNAAYERIWGRGADALQADPTALLAGVHPEDRERVRDAIARVPARGGFDMEFRVLRPDGELRWVWSRAFPVRNERGEIYRMAGIAEDVTERKGAQQQLERVMESRTRLVRGFTHDVKNPLGAADGMLQMLEDGLFGGVSDPQSQAIGRARRSIRSGLGLIEQLLDLARAEAGQLEVRAQSMDVAGVAREVAEEFAAQARGRGLTLRVEAPDDLPAVLSDPARVRQVLSNLVSNAVKYTRDGGITVRARCVHRVDAAGGPFALAVDVIDTGIGIPRDKLALLFREFTRIDPDAADGSGIGLAISQRVARALKGEITVESEAGRGSTFTLWLPLSGQAAPRETSDSAGRAHPLNIGADEPRTREEGLD